MPASDSCNSVDPIPVEWSSRELPDTWPDKLNYKQFASWVRVLKKALGKTVGTVEVPTDMHADLCLPKYLLQEFHNIPNGNYSKRVTRGYINGFDHSMLGEMQVLRKRVATTVAACSAVLDVGCGGGRSTVALAEAGIADVWGVDPSPYLLQHAALDHPGLKLVQGLAEDIPFPDERFDAITASFVFHEIPPKYADQALREFNRVLRPGGIVSLAEPSPAQLQLGYWEMLKRYGFKGLYFRLLARSVFEPFVDAWHQKNYAQWAAGHGFELISDEDQFPSRYLVFRKLSPQANSNNQ